ncbi:DUF1566 domain-containing protein [Patescibacteria group bacterium]|nr:DUF1566 domain-containing protein [Patescibacteria group bacterium]MBU4512738.1 DUF1566 domain-containing protein [Patescibacteria group bacterium]MCG2693078.1 DUF1566 domain-containing protein [Candidatus Parcubacteria bacterium]
MSPWLATLKFILVVVASIGLVAAIVKAGSLTPSASPAATFYTLTDIYNRLATNATNTEANHDFAPSALPAATLYTLKQIYEAIPDIATTTVKLGTSYLGVAGTLTPDGGTAAAADVFSAKTAHLTADWTLDTGTLVLACATSSFDGADNLVSTAYDGAGDGSNRWCMKDTGDAADTDILAGKIAWVDGVEVTGSITTQTLSDANDTVSAGYYEATTLAAVDSYLASANIKSGVTIFGFAGNVNVVDTSAGDAAAGDIANDKIAFVDGAQVTGSMFTNQKNQTKDDWVSSTGTSGEYTGEEATWTIIADLPASDYQAINYLGSVAAGEDEPSELDLFSGMIKRDGRTGLYWSDVAAEAGSASSTKNTFGAVTDGTRPTGGRAIGFCNALNSYNSGGGFGGYSDWYLPTQKQLQQAYIDGSANSLPNPGNNFWSSTENYNNTANAWNVNLNNGNTSYGTKTFSYNVRCVR